MNSPASRTCLAVFVSLLCLSASAGRAWADVSQTPGTPDLNGNCDSGVSNSDDITQSDNSSEPNTPTAGVSEASL